MSAPMQVPLSAPPSEPAESFDWPVAFQAENVLRTHVERFLQNNLWSNRLAQRMRSETGTDFFEWIDHLVLPVEEEKALRSSGFVTANVETYRGGLILEHPRATLPRVKIEKGQSACPACLALRVASVADFVQAHGLNAPIEGAPFSRLRRTVGNRDNGTVVEVLERNSYRGFVPAPLHPVDLKNIIHSRDIWRTRRRHWNVDAQGFAATTELLEQISQSIGCDLTCQLFFEAERRYWELRNRAAQIQKQRQDRLGLGWGNHDHHTYRCSREHFMDLIQFLLRLGFQRRERYYAGEEAGWGAQISEQQNAGIVVFADVDLMPQEVEVDFSNQRLPSSPRLGTVGLWVALHGESFLEAGMHHLEARFDFDAVRDQWLQEGVQSMKPFSNFEFLRQAFTEAERWPVRRERAERLRDAGLITARQFEQFTTEGALGSHLENLQRHGGFKGFNQKSVSAIISATDPRKNLQTAAA